MNVKVLSLVFAVAVCGCQLPPLGDCDDDMHFELRVEVQHGDEVEAAQAVNEVEGRVFAMEWDSRRSGCNWTSASGREVYGGAKDGIWVQLYESTYQGHYQGATTGYAGAYEIGCEGNTYVVEAPALSSVALSSPVIARGDPVEITWSPAQPAKVTAQLIVIDDSSGDWVLSTGDYLGDDGSHHFQQDTFARPGEYTLRLIRTLHQEYVDYVGEGSVAVSYDAKLLVE